MFKNRKIIMPAKIYSRFLSLLIIMFLTIHFDLSGQEKQPYSDIKDAVLSSAKLEGNSGPSNVQWIDDGDSYSYTLKNSLTDHKEIRQLFPATLEDKLIVDTDVLIFPSSGERFNYKSFSWAKDSKHILFQTNFRPIYRNSGIADYFIYNTADKNLKLLVKDARTAELSPDGSMVGYERDGNMYTYIIANAEERQLTRDASETLYNGHFDWVYEEEFGIPQAWSWSPDSRYIAFWQFDESNEPVFQMTDYEGQHPDYVKFRVPLVGDPNAEVKIGIINVESGAKVWFNTGEEYIPRVYWTSEPDQLAVMTLNRKQNDMKLFFFNVINGKKKLVLEEKSDTWVDIHNFYERVMDMIYFPDKIKEFFWLSDRDGYQHIYRYNYDGKLLNQVTKGEWTVTRVEGINTESGKIYYTSTEVSPLERQLYSINFDGTGKERLSEETGRHSFDLSPNTAYYIDTYSNINLPSRVELWSTKGRKFLKLEDNRSVTEFIQHHKYSAAGFFNFTTADGTNIDGEMIKPFDFDSTKKYPVVFDIYGGPNSQDVHNEFGTDTWKQWLAQQGFIVVDINNRGNANYGSRFMKIVYEHLGKWESNDYVETLKYLSSIKYVDTSRTAIMGGSYGGYITVYTMLMHPGLFKVGLANSAVTDWLLYDNIYTERYMGLINENETGYEESSDVQNAGNLDGKLLIIHSTMDDNVHVQNTMQLLTALTNAGKDADLRIYPSGAHGAVYNTDSELLMLNVYNDFLLRYLK
jgi:dipeptidyl-peptidase-4